MNKHELCPNKQFFGYMIIGPFSHDSYYFSPLFYCFECKKEFRLNCYDFNMEMDIDSVDKDQVTTTILDSYV